ALYKYRFPPPEAITALDTKESEKDSYFGANSDHDAPSKRDHSDTLVAAQDNDANMQASDSESNGDDDESFVSISSSFSQEEGIEHSATASNAPSEISQSATLSTAPSSSMEFSRSPSPLASSATDPTSPRTNLLSAEDDEDDNDDDDFDREMTQFFQSIDSFMNAPLPSTPPPPKLQPLPTPIPLALQTYRQVGPMAPGAALVSHGSLLH
ncbi:hypothetical protein HK405_007885, partial [Cladochytrium tenue]